MPKKRQGSIESAFANKLDQEQALKLYYKYFIEDNIPAHFTESQNWRNFLSYVSPNFQVPSRQKLTRDIAQLGEEAKGTLSDLLSEVNFVATTAHSWVVNNRSFLGMTADWVNSTSLKRETAVLGIKEIQGVQQQTETCLAKAMMDLHREFGISNKVIGTTTANGMDYVAAFKLFAASNVEISEIDMEEVG
jgi:hypothetical protein